jgi:hypothetical protein
MVPESAENQVITIMAFALGNYLYKLDGNSVSGKLFTEFVGITL